MGKHKGFTIVELMVVVLIIAILTRLVVVAYNNTQARSRDAIRKNDLATLAKQIQIYGQQKQTFTGNCGDSADTLNGYTTLDYAVAGNTSITACLKTYDPTNKQLNDPSGCVSMPADYATDQAAGCKTSIRSAYRAYNTGTHYFLVTKLETETGQLAAYTDADVSGVKTDMTNAGFNYILKVR